MWDELKEKQRPLVLYGTGNAAEKILKELDIRGIRVSGIFASDGFVRDRSFAGFKVLSYEEAKAKFGPMTVLLCFGSHRPEVIETILRVDAEQDLYAPDLPVAGEGLFTCEYYEVHRAELAWVRGRLADEKSRAVFDSLIEYRLGGRVRPLLACQSPEAENWQLLRGASEPARAAAAASGMRSEAPAFLDLGAYTGDTVALFLAAFGGRFSRIIAVEPESRNFRKLQETAARLFSKDTAVQLSGVNNIAEKHLSTNSFSEFRLDKERSAQLSSIGSNAMLPENIHLVNAAVGDRCGTALFTHGAGRGGAASKGKVRPVTLTTVDSLLGGQPIDIIKMDLEGAESSAIRGAEQTIKRCRPAMLISAYHRTEDLFTIPKQILDLVPDYRLYLRKDPCIPAWGVNYYFVQ